MKNTSNISDYEEKFKQKLDAYAKDYRVEELNQSNDKAQLRMLISAELMLEAIEKEIQNIIASENLIDKANEVKKLSDLVKDTAATITTGQRTLAIDRKTRKSEETDSVAAYIRGLKRDAKQFLEDRLIKIYCMDCKVLCGRFSPVHDHTAFQAAVQCSQCKKWARANRIERDIWFDLKKDSEWRRKYPVEIVPPSAKEGFNPGDLAADVEDEYTIEGDAL
jgi:hypothetical protein